MERNGFIFFTVRNEVAKVMFLHVSVILSTGEGAIPACIADGIPACLAAGEVPGPGGPYSRGGAWSREGLLWGCLVLGGCLVPWGLLPGGVDTPLGPGTSQKQMATVADGMHPTGMQSFISVRDYL